MKQLDWFDLIVKRLSGMPKRGVWSDGREILCETESEAQAVAELIESLYFAQNERVRLYMGYCDQEHPHWGWWFVRVLCRP